MLSLRRTSIPIRDKRFLLQYILTVPEIVANSHRRTNVLYSNIRRELHLYIVTSSGKKPFAQNNIAFEFWPCSHIVKEPIGQSSSSSARQMLKNG